MNMPVAQEVTAISATSIITQGDSFDRVMRLAEVMASGVATVPKHLQKNVGDCAAIIMQSMQWNMSPFAVAQKTHLIGGVLGYEAQLVNAVITSMAPTKDRLNFEWFGDWEKIVGKFREVESKTKKDDDGHPKKYRVPAWNLSDESGLGVKVWATLKGESTPRVLELLMTQARTRNSTLWTDDPKQQLAYLGIKRWSRLYCPDVILGVYTPDEIEVDAPEREINPSAQAEPARKEIDSYPKNSFLENFPKWEKLIVTGKKTAEDIISMVGSKAKLSDEQVDAIRAIPAPIDGQAEEVQS